MILVVPDYACTYSHKALIATKRATIPNAFPECIRSTISRHTEVWELPVGIVSERSVTAPGPRGHRHDR